MRRLYFCPVRSQNSVRDGLLLSSDRRRPGNRAVRAACRQRIWRDCAAVQALLLAHGGITTLGANAVSMAVVGPIVGFLVYQLARKMGCRQGLAIFLCAFIADLATYLVTSVQLGIVFPDPASGMMASIFKFMAIFCTTQVPIAIAEGLLTTMMYNLIQKNLPAKAAQWQ